MREERAAILMTAHHENDLAETILMKLLRGGDVKQLIGIRAVQDFEMGKLVRPLLSFTKADLRAFAKTQQLTWFEDATNEQDETLRNRIRHHVMPLLQQENEQFLLHIQQYSEQLAQQQMVVADWAEQTAQELKGKDGINLPVFLRFT
ncbi:tRNA lysidine(34) synthetase TilS [Secundilactobacillus oryzae]|uniref:tRNA lysidine(34) synthetase TilS n=1 Tax=Secundilactobacillus oryzae TaxID=1202668 RepID=UPI000A5C4700|nr:tRNA lysidine(34) synthetase TilS [Secundilactobacillus oryzae]